MNPQNMIIDKQQYQQTATHFLSILFGESLKNNCGEIEISGFDDGPKFRSYHDNVTDAVNAADQACQQGLDVYVGVNPRVDQAGTKENIHWLAAFHAEVDYGKAGHKTKPEYDAYDDALEGIKAFQIPPTLINHSGGGFHCYWVLNDPAKVSKLGLGGLEDVNGHCWQELKRILGLTISIAYYGFLGHSTSKFLRMSAQLPLFLIRDRHMISMCSELSWILNRKPRSSRHLYPRYQCRRINVGTKIFPHCQCQRKYNS